MENWERNYFKRNIWFISDHHWQHANILKFTKNDGSLVRPGFESVEHMNEIMIERWNATVKPEDKIYHLGDIALGQKDDWPKIFSRLNGHKRLILGNHDHKDMRRYLPFFEEIMSWRQFKDMPVPFICCHYPLREDTLNGRKSAFCVHGHIHDNLVMKNGRPDPLYINVCVERRNYTPVHIEDLMAEMKKN